MEQTSEKTSSSLIERLFEAGAHFGFSKSRRHPSVKPFIFGSKQGTDIFDLEQTSELIAEASAFLSDVGSKGKPILFVGTKEEISDIVQAAAEELAMPRITNRWIGGTFTNLPEIKKRVERLTMLEDQRVSGELDRKYTKKERLLLEREVEKLAYNFGGIVGMDSLPGAIVVVDPRHESIAVSEAVQTGVPVVAIMSSDCNLNEVTKPVVVNDANRASVQLVITELVNAYRDGKKAYVPKSDARPPKRDTVASGA